MKTLVNGTSVDFLARWIYAIEEDIKKHKFYCLKSYGDPNYLCILPINKARLLVMYEIFHITSNDYSESQSDYFKAYNTKKSLERGEKVVLAYLETMKALLEIM